MKHPILYSASLAALLSISGKMLYHFQFAPSEDWDMYTRFFYLFCFLAALFFGLQSWKVSHQGSSFPDDVKSGMKITSIYSLIIAPFTWAYYTWINPRYFEQRIANAISAARSSGSSDEDIAQISNTVSFIFDSFTHATITLFGFMVLGLFYTLIVVLIFRSKPKMFGI